MGWDGLLLLNILHNNQLKELGHTSNNAMASTCIPGVKLMYEPLTPNKLPNNLEDSDTFINKAVLPIQEPFTINIIESLSFTIYHLPSWNQLENGFI